MDWWVDDWITRGQNKFEEKTFWCVFHGFVGKGTMTEMGSIKFIK